MFCLAHLSKALRNLNNIAMRPSSWNRIIVYKQFLSYNLHAHQALYSEHAIASLSTCLIRRNSGGDLKPRKAHKIHRDDLPPVKSARRTVDAGGDSSNSTELGQGDITLKDQSLQRRQSRRSGSLKKAQPTQSGLGSGVSERKPWQIQKAALEGKFGDQGWNPRKRLSPDALEGIRALHKQDPLKNSTEALAGQFQVSPEAIRRILKSKWRPSEAEEAGRRRRWNKRGEQIWAQMMELGVRPPKKWKETDVATLSPGSRRGEHASDDMTATISAPKPEEQSYEPSLSIRIL